MFTFKTPGVIALGAILVLAFGAVAINQYQTNKEVTKLEEPTVITKTVIVTATPAPTATPSAVKIFTPAKASNVVKGVK